MRTVRVCHSIESEWLRVAPVRLGHVPPGAGTPERYVTVETELGEPVLRCDVYAGSGSESFVFEAALTWQEWLVIGFGNTLHLVGLEGGSLVSISLGSYFGHLYPTDECLLVASAKNLIRFDRDGSLRWRSPMLGLDGVVVRRVLGGVIEGEGEWDPPRGRRPFRVSSASGAPLGFS